MMMANALKGLRVKAGLSQSALAERIGVTAQAVSKWERGRSMPDANMLPIIADLFQVTIDTLFGRESTGLSFPDDDCLRVIQCLGAKMVQSDECKEGKTIRLHFPNDVEHRYPAVAIWGNAEVAGDINGNVSCAANITCGTIAGSVTAGGDVYCGSVLGSVTAGAHIHHGQKDNG